MAVMKMDNTISQPNQIISYWHCKQCIDEKPRNMSPAEWTRLWVGITKEGLQVWCSRHNLNVALFSWAEPSDKENNPTPLDLKCAMCDEDRPHGH